MAKKNEDKENKKVDTKKAKSNDKDKKSFAKDFKAELKKVTWPTPKQLVNNTTAVIVSVLVVAAIVFVLDVAFETMNNYGVEKLKALVTSETQNTVDTNTVNDGTTVIDGSSDTSGVSNETTTEPTVDGNADTNTTAQTNTVDNTVADTNTVDTNTTSPEGQSGQ